jgi:hypothetical protein
VTESADVRDTAHTQTALARAPQARSRAPLCSAQLSCPVSGLAASARSSMVRGARQAPPDPSGKPAAHEPSATQPADTRVQTASHARRRRDRDTQHVAGLPRTTQHNNTRNASAIFTDTKYMRQEYRIIQDEGRIGSSETRHSGQSARPSRVRISNPVPARSCRVLDYLRAVRSAITLNHPALAAVPERAHLRASGKAFR